MKQDGHARLDLIDVSLFAPFYPMGKFGGLKLKNSFCKSSPQLTKRDKKLYIKKKAPVVIKVSKIIGHGRKRILKKMVLLRAIKIYRAVLKVEKY